MSLQEQLSTLKAQTIANLPEELAAVMVDETEKLTASGIVALAPKPGDIFEDFTLPNHLGGAFVNADYTVRAEPSDVLEVLRSLVKQNA